MFSIGHKHCELWHMSQLLLAIAVEVWDRFINILTATHTYTHWSGSFLMLSKALWHTSLSALISSLNPLCCKAARRNLKHRLLGNCVVMTALQQGYTGESEFYLLLKRARWEKRGQGEASGPEQHYTEPRPFTMDICMILCWSVIRSRPALTTDSSAFIWTYAAS